MTNLTLSEIAKALNATYSEDATITDVVIDTRKITKGCLFICIVGERFDAHSFALDAKNLGAGAIMVSKDVDVDIPTIKVLDTSKALLELSAYYRSKFSIPIVALTGSVGKTTTKEFTYLVVSSKYKAIKTLGNLNNEIGLPQMLFKIDESTEAAVIEMGMNHFGEIHRLVMATRPTVALITNIGVSHIENLGSREGILKSKLEILDGLEDSAPLILNSDNDMLKTVKDINHPIITYGIDSGEIRVKNIAENNSSTSFIIDFYGRTQEVTIPTIGIHNVYNALAAFSVGLTLNIEPSECAKALSKYVPEGMRQKSVNVNGIISIEDCYNASPDSMRAAIKTLANTKSNKKIAVLGDMLELGDYSKNAHTEVGKMVAENNIDCLLAFGSDAKYIVLSAKKNGLKKSFYFDNKNELLDKLLTVADSGDAVIFKASRGMKLEEVIHLAYDRWEKE